MGRELLNGRKHHVYHSPRRKINISGNGFEQSELLEPRQALDEAGAQTQVVSPVDGKVKGWNHTDWGDDGPVDVPA